MDESSPHDSYIMAQSVWSWAVGCFKICSLTRSASLPPESQMDTCPSGFLCGEDHRSERLELDHRLAAQDLHLRVRSAACYLRGMGGSVSFWGLRDGAGAKAKWGYSQVHMRIWLFPGVWLGPWSASRPPGHRSAFSKCPSLFLGPTGAL